eukprot:CAMPEP_0119025280 /NCGR_PEP_ID=MMETSP1176-20130426/33450_1 /TAXON_ID=265551 /ORGANISM="Synedropsis recta cf, Strain CCMP1620" /LENGTH=92 /DNA_ID=CAMNT_0006980781 /DNA_START=190 /DNA_END=468 /DNA_ORIENTATION=+
MAPKTNDYQPKQSKHLPKVLKEVPGDGDMWVERVVYDDKGRKRSFFQSVKTDHCVWDEPPSGASRLVLATDVPKYPFLQKYRSAPPPRNAVP